MRRSRAARLVGVAATLVACGGTSPPTDGGTGSDASVDGAVPPDGGWPGVDAGQDASSDGSSDASARHDGTIALYGAAPPPSEG